MIDVATQMESVRRARDAAYGALLDRLEEVRALPTPARVHALREAEKRHLELRARFMDLHLLLSDPGRRFRDRQLQTAAPRGAALHV